MRLAALLALAQYSKVGFDGISKTKAAAKLQAALDVTALRAYALQLQTAFLQASGTGEHRTAVSMHLCDYDVSFYNSTASTWTLATPRTTWEL